MSLANILKLSSGALNAQTVRLNTIASNLANVDTTASSAQQAYKAKRPVFEALLDDATGELQTSYGVQVNKITESAAVNPQIYDPQNPMADKDGYVYRSNVNPMEEMTDMLDAARSYESALTVSSTARHNGHTVM